ncbi:DEAD/DEAH box helicase [Paenibacillus sp. OAS669]|uniref:DEAD/DEAH box helicase n=1 Tax=Paenibacillus sp. OAS669 TaxID=2663821 RepID=UPI00178BF94B|nr:DEAD/DEAH box helicase [Paenibacillus sp. OAS669]MBE1442012.1 SNF2 family DNA or RNA helicase [Paenibacillus sp. OAS669]
MSLQLTSKVIKQLCGQLAYDKGDAYYRAGKASLFHYDPWTALFEIKVAEDKKNLLHCTVQFDRRGNVLAKCTCPTLKSYDKYCKHIAAALLYIQAARRDGTVELEPQETSSESEELPSIADNGSAAADAHIVGDMLGLFAVKPLRTVRAKSLLDEREPLQVEILCKPFAYGYHKYMFGVEIRLGPKRLYIVQHIRDFLDRLERGEAVTFSPQFTYDPKLHSFQQEHDALFRQLIEIHRHESMYRETAGRTPGTVPHQSNDRLLPIPPFFWGALLPLLSSAPSVKLDMGGRLLDGLQLSSEPLPVSFEFDRSSTDYVLSVKGLDQLMVMEAYEVVLSEGKLIQLKEDSCKRLSQLKQMLESSQKQTILIQAGQMESFMETVIPGLMKLGSVHISKAVTERITQMPLQAKLYLDRVRDRLLAGLEFHYGEIVINPLESHRPHGGTDHILLRDGEQERRILELMDQSAFVKTESGYFMEDEEGEYDFLYHIVPELEKLVKVYATSAVKVRLLLTNPPPKIMVDVDERTDWLEFKFDIQGIPESEIRSLLQSLEEKRRYYRLPNGALMPLESEEFQAIVNFMNEVGLRQNDLKGTAFQLPVTRALHLTDSHTRNHSIQLGKSFRRLLENLRNPDHLEFPVPDNLDSVLRDYQKYGYQWLKTLAHYRFGGILADDMGLGKTLQSIAFLVSVLPEIRSQKVPAIIVSPASLTYNWLHELNKFAPELRALVVDGTRAERSRMVKAAHQYDVIITSYPLLRRDLSMYVEPSFHTLILDEAQVFKNHTTQTAQAVKELRAQYRFALTGTPIENRLEELWSIFDAVFPGLFASRRAFSELTRGQVARRVRPFLLRRLKTDVLRELPEKIESLQASELLPEQKKLYAAYLAKLRQETLKHLDEDTFQQNRIKILAGLTRLRQICCHPALFVEDYAGSSAKLEQLLDIVEECRGAGKRMLIFSQFTEMLKFIGKELGYQGIRYFYLDGDTPTRERVELCNRFNDGERDLFLISMKAGGTGLNLTGADTVVLYDLWWNPAVEQQAADRAHRLGQKSVVQVIRLVSRGTVEDKMYELQQRKKHLIDEIIQPGEGSLSSLSEQDIREILMIT